MELNDYYIILIHKQFTGEITPAESAQLGLWMQESPENHQYATELRLVWEKTGEITPVFEPNLDADFALLQQRIRATDQPVLRVVSRTRLLMRAAAVLVILIAAIGIWRFYLTPGAPAQVEFAANTDLREVLLPDGTHVWLRRDGRIDFPQQFLGAERRVRLSGEAYFDVFHNAAQPFRVELPGGGLVEVLGTQFDIRALPGESETTVLVKTGKVRFSPDGKQTGPVLITGQKAVFARPQSRISVVQVDSYNELAWQTGGLEFVKTPLATVMSDLERYYKVHIELRNTALRTATYTAPLTNQPIEKVLQSIALTYRMQVQKTSPDHFVLTGGSDN